MDEEEQDIVERLYEEAHMTYEGGIYLEAATEIERLRALCDYTTVKLKAVKAEREALARAESRSTSGPYRAASPLENAILILLTVGPFVFFGVVLFLLGYGPH